MKTFEIEILETLIRVVEVQAESSEEAVEKVREQYDNEEIVLDAEDCIEIQIEDIQNL